MYHIFLLVRHSMDEDISSDAWDIRSMTPIYKFGDSSNVANYRPISILSFFSKLFNSIVYICIKIHKLYT